MENPRQQSRPAYRKFKNRLKTNTNIFFSFIKSRTSDSFGNNFDGHFAYLKTLDFSFKRERGVHTYNYMLSGKCVNKYYQKS